MGFKEVISRAQLKRAGGGGGLAINTRIQGGETQERVQQQSCDANANDFYQAMREKRKIERESNGGGGEQEDRRGSKTTLQLEAYDAGTKRNAPLQTSSTTKDPGLSYQNAPGATLKEKIALRRAALEKENKEKELEEQKETNRRRYSMTLPQKLSLSEKCPRHLVMGCPAMPRLNLTP